MTDVRQLRETLALAQAQLVDRLKDDPLANFKPHKKQQDFIDSILKGKTRQSWCFASNRSGKTEGAAYIGSTLARYGMPKNDVKYNASIVGGTHIESIDRATSGWVISQDFNASRDAVQPKYFDNGHVPPAAHRPFIPEREVAGGIDGWHVQNQILKLKNGSIIGFKSGDSKTIKFASAEKDWIHFDEEPRKELYEECVIRVGSRPLRIFGSCTLLPPEGGVGGVSWMFGDFIQPWQEGKMPDVQMFSMSIYDNPYIGKEEIRLMESVYPEGSVTREIRLEGKWLPGMSGARCHPTFSKDKHVSVQPDWNPRMPLCWMLDFNVAPFVTVVGQKDGQTFRFYDELVLEEGVHDDMCQLFYEKFSNHKGEVWVYGDATGKRRSAQTGQSDYNMILAGMRKYQRSLKLRVPDSNPPVPDRINAVNRQLRDEHGQVNISIDPECKELIADFEQVLRDPRGGIKKSHKANDPYYRRTHALDCAGYWVSYEAPVSPVMEKKRQSMGIIIPKPGYGFAKRG